jgi:acetyl esterase/lipase
MRIRYIFGLFLFSLISLTISAQQKVVYIYDGAAPGTEHWNWQEGIHENNSWRTQVVYNVTKPSLTVYTPEPGKANGTAVVICPGGGFIALAMGNEGYDVAKWLVQKGVTCFVLKYRVAHVPTNDPVKYFNEAIHGGDTAKQRNQREAIPLGIADGKAAIAYVRAHTKEYNINPDRIGVVGFSAGGTLAASAAFNYTAENKPNFVAPIYAFFPKAMQGKVADDAPPMFIAVAANDPLNLQPHSVDLFTTWNTAKKDVELHIYNQGGHGFGMRVQHTTSDTWIERFADWLAVKGLLTK